MTKSRLILLLLGFFFPLCTYAQGFGDTLGLTEKKVRDKLDTETEQRLVIDCSVFMEEDYSYYAEIITDKLLEFQPNNANYNFRKGALLIESHTDASNAIPYLRQAITDTDLYAEMYSAKEKSSPVDAFYYLGKAFHLEGLLDSSEIYYQKHIDKALPESDKVALSRLGIKQCRVARREIANPKSTRVENVGEVINNNFPDYAPVVSLDGSALYYTSRRPWEDGSTERFKDPQFNHFPEDIYCSYIDFDGSWIDPFKLDFCIGVRNEATTSVSADERRIYVYQDDSTGNGDIYYSDFKTNRFQEIEFLDYKNVNLPDSWEPHAMVSTDGLFLYFSSNRPGGFGGRDLYRSVKLPDNSWSEPINLGPTVNTPYDEDSPFLAIDNKTMYFSSN